MKSIKLRERDLTIIYVPNIKHKTIPLLCHQKRLPSFPKTQDRSNWDKRMISLTKSGTILVFSLCHSCRAFLAVPAISATRSITLVRSPQRSLLATGALVTALILSNHCRTTAGSSSCTQKRSSSSSSCDAHRTMSTGYLNAEDAAALDAELMSTPGFALEQLMELAGLSVAEAVYEVLLLSPTKLGRRQKILLVCGPGNNGGDGLVAARHLTFFGYDCTVVYPKQSTKQHFVNLVHQSSDVDVDILTEMPSDLTSYDGIVDAIFGFSFKGEPREPFATALKQMMEAQQAGVPIISVDVPSGWNVDEGDVSGSGFVPDVLVSLTTPKESARFFQGRHFVGGRFLPPRLAEKYNVQMPPYPGVRQVMEITKNAGAAAVEEVIGESSKSAQGQKGWEAEYASYLEEKGRHERAALSVTDNVPPPVSDAMQNERVSVVDGSWEQEYAEYCKQKEARLAEEDARQIQEMKQQRMSS